MKNIARVAPLLLLSLGAAGSRSDAPFRPGPLGSVRYTLADEDLRPGLIPKGSELLSVSEGALTFQSPVHSLALLDEVAPLSHQKTEMCGSVEYFPLHSSTADTVSHSPPYYDAELKFETLSPVIAEVNLSSLRSVIDTLTALPSRYHRHSTGRDASQTVQQIWQDRVQVPGDWSITEFPHTVTPQRSVIARLEGETDETVILGAHLDSITSRTNAEANAPGADDDASGIAILSEILRIIEARGLRFHRTIELQAYAAEEVGLIGSQDIAYQYRQAGRKIAGMLQFDMAFYSEAVDQGQIHFLEDFTSLDLTRSAMHWLKAYVGDVFTRGAMPYGAASDHKSFWKQGYPTLFPFENPSADNPHIHTLQDTTAQFDDGLRAERMTQLGLLFLAYQAGLKGLEPTQEVERSRIAALATPKDLHLAVHGEGPYEVAVSAPAETVYLEFCRIDAARDLRCVDTRERLTTSQLREDRKVYTSSNVIGWNPGEKWRFEAFDAKDNLIARRHVSWEQP